MMRAVTKRARVVRVMVTTMRVAWDKEGDCDGSKSDGDKGVVQGRGRWQWRQEQWRRGWWASDDNGDGNDVGDGNGDGNKAGDKAGGRHRGQVQGQQEQWQQQ